MSCLAKTMQKGSRRERLLFSATVNPFVHSSHPNGQGVVKQADSLHLSIVERFKVLSSGQGGGRRSRATPEHSKSDSGINGDLIFQDNSH